MRGESFPAEGERMANLAGGLEYDPNQAAPSLPPDQEFKDWGDLPPVPQKKWNQMSTFEKVGQYMMGRQHYLDPHEQSPRGPRSSTFMGDMSKLLKKAGGDNTPVFSGGRRGLKY